MSREFFYQRLWKFCLITAVSLPAAGVMGSSKPAQYRDYALELVNDHDLELGLLDDLYASATA